jgi:hypothetical protein
MRYVLPTYGVGTSPFSGTGNNLDSNQYNVQAANALGLGVYLGANLQFANGGLDLVRTKMEIDLAPSSRPPPTRARSKR